MKVLLVLLLSPSIALAQSGNTQSAPVRLLCDSLNFQASYSGRKTAEGGRVWVTPLRGGKEAVVLDRNLFKDLVVTDQTYQWTDQWTDRHVAQKRKSLTTRTIDRFTGRYVVTIVASQTLQDEHGIQTEEQGSGSMEGRCEPAPEKPRL